MIRNATATWKGGPGAGEGTVSTSSGVISNALYSFGSSNGNEPCTSPSEMLAAAVASCVSLMVAQEMARAHLRPEDVRTQAELKLEETRGHWKITGIELSVSAHLDPKDAEIFIQASKRAKAKCPISHALKVPVKMTASVLEPEHALVV